MIDYLFADRAYDTDQLIAYGAEHGIELVIAPKKNRIDQRDYDEYLYKIRHLVENAFLHLKRWRGIATRYATNISSFAAAVEIRIIALWLKISWLQYLANIYSKYLSIPYNLIIESFSRQSQYL